MSNNHLIPNTFQHANAYIDWLSYYLTPEEEKVLNKAIREIIGWHDTIKNRKARIALSVFANGKKNKEGKILCLGCGLSTGAIRKALESLDSFNVLCKVGQPNNDGQMYYLQENWDAIDFESMKARKKNKHARNQRRTNQARKEKNKLPNKTDHGVLSDNNPACSETTHMLVVGQQQGNQKKPKETQEQTIVCQDFFVARKKHFSLPDKYTDVPLLPQKALSFNCPECNRVCNWPSRESERRKYHTLVCQDPNCKAYFSVEVDGGKVYKFALPEEEWIIDFEIDIPGISRLYVDNDTFQEFYANCQEDMGIVIEKLQWATTQSWLIHQKDKIISRVNSAYETSIKPRIAQQAKNEKRDDEKQKERWEALAKQLGCTIEQAKQWVKSQK
jgi:hypothetical protein